VASPNRAHIALVCEDAGPAAAWAPVVLELQRRGFSLSVWATGRAKETFGRRNIPTLTFCESWLDDRPALVMTGTAGWGDRIDARAVRAARHASIPTLSYVDFWWRYPERFTHHEPLDSLPDVIAVVDERMRDGVTQAISGVDRIVVTGSPLLDEARSALREPVSDGAPVLFLSQPLEALYGTSSADAHAIGYTERDVLPIVARATASHRLELRVRAHPREDAGALRSFLGSLAGTPKLSEGRTIHEDIAESRAVVGMTTMGLAEAALMGRPTLSIQLSAATLSLPTFGTALGALAQDERAVTLWLDALVEGSLLQSDSLETSAGAVERLADAVERLLSERAAPR